MTEYVIIDIPFESRYRCWFCGEPSNGTLRCLLASYAPQREGIELPVCTECASFADKKTSKTIWPLRLHIKNRLLNRYAKHLGIGVTWTKEELEQSQLEGAIFEGFRASAWKMYEIARERVDFQGWPLMVDGAAVESFDDTFYFEFLGTRFLSVTSAMEFYVKSEGLDELLLSGLLSALGKEQFEHCLRIARVNPNPSRAVRSRLLDEVEQQIKERNAMTSLSNSTINAIDVQAIKPVQVNQLNVEPEAIAWVMNKGIATLAVLMQFEDRFFEEHEHLGGPRAFQLYNGIQWYLEAREDHEWGSKDPNEPLWLQLKRRVAF
ncbi:hypothetical protein [Vibrio sp. 10N.261.51.F12]|uniref:hypothetical protein n=1 Tax=Vibrio sp. 10N.261.51.F12 TaxID=3229679 RepID=UPI003550CBDA